MTSESTTTTMSDTLEAIIEKAHQGDLQGAHDALLPLLEANPEDESIALNLASISFDLEKYDFVAELCRGLIKQGCEHAGAHLLLSRVYYLKGDIDLGYDHIRQAWIAAPESHDIALDFLIGARNRYWTLRPEEFATYLERSEKGEIALEEAQRFVHQAFARIVQPELLERLCNAEEGDSSAVIPTWKANLDAEKGKDLSTLWNNFKEGLRVIFNEPEWSPRAATLTMRDDSTMEVERLGDLDPLSLASLELIDAEGAIGYFPFGAIESVTFGPMGLTVPVTMKLKGGSEHSGITGLATPFSHFSRNPDLVGARKFVLRRMDDDVALPIGARFLTADQNLVPLGNIKRIEFKDAPSA